MVARTMQASIANTDNLAGIALALGLGLLVGVQRGWALRNEAEGSRFAGVRTYGLLGLAGGVAGALADRSEALAGIVLGGSAVLILLSYWRMTQLGRSLSGTASIAGLLTLSCGFLAASGERLTATAIAVAMALLLAMRRQLHGIVSRMSETEVLAVVRFALIAAVILPLLPDRAFGPFDAWNPRKLWLVVVLVSGFSFAGYVAAKLLGPSRGTIATSAAGAMVSSTAVTASLANRLKTGDGNEAVNHAGIAVASAIMFARTVVLTAMLAPFALPLFAVLAAPGLGASALASLYFLWHARKAHRTESDTISVRNPFDIGPALLLMALVMLATLASRYVLDSYGDAGLATVLALTGIVDVDSAIIAMGNMPAGSLSPRIAALVLLLAVLLNTLLKALAAISIAGWKRAWPAFAALVASALASLCALPWVL